MIWLFLFILYVAMIALTAYLYGRVDPEAEGDTPDVTYVALLWPIGLLVVAYYYGEKHRK